METNSALPNGAGRIVRDEAAGGDSPAPHSSALADWLQQFARTVKTCRLYDAGNPTVEQFRHDLAAGLVAILEAHGTVELNFGPETVFLGETPLQTGRSRDDNLALAFFRDGIRALSLLPGIQRREIDALLNAYLQVTRRGSEDDDLVTLLWEANLDHVFLKSVSTEGDVETGSDASGEDLASGAVAPWPRPGEPAAQEPTGSAASEGPGAGPDDTGRSDDRITSGDVRNLESSLLRLEIGSGLEVDRLRAEFEAERTRSMAQIGFELIRDCLTGATAEADRAELRAFLPRLLREAVANGAWTEARECLYLLRDPGSPRDPVGAFVSELGGRESVTSANAWKQLESQSPSEYDAFFEFARELGPEALDWLVGGLAESNRRPLRQGLVTALAPIVREQPERLAPWLADERWYVVRNVVQVLGLLDGPPPLGLLRAVIRHPELRVRREAILTLTRAPHAEARPLLMEMLRPGSEPLYASVLRALAAGPDPELATILFGWIEKGDAETWTEVDRRATYQALAITGGDEVVPLLESHVFSGHWFSRGDESQRMSAAMCLARIGTPAARAMLERGAHSRRSEIARACLAGLASLRSHAEGESS